MDAKVFKDLERDDLVKHVVDPRIFVVTGNHGSHVTATTTVDITNPSEWKLVQKARVKKGKFGVVVIETHEESKCWTSSVESTIEDAEEARRALEARMPGAKIEICDWSDLGLYNCVK